MKEAQEIKEKIRKHLYKKLDLAMKEQSEWYQTQEAELCKQLELKIASIPDDRVHLKETIQAREEHDAKKEKAWRARYKNINDDSWWVSHRVNETEDICKKIKWYIENGNDVEAKKYFVALKDIEFYSLPHTSK